jgi:multidrug resistance efflux pump
MRSFTSRFLPLVVWTAAAGVFCLLLRDRTPMGHVKAVAQTSRYSVIAPLEGELAAWSVQEHQTVQCGQVVGQIQNELVRLQLASARMELDRLRAELRSEEVQLETDRHLERYDRDVDRIGELRRLYRDLEAARVDALATKAVIEESRVQQDGIGIELNRLLALDKQGITSGSELTLQKTEHDTVKKRISELEIVLAGHEDRMRAARDRIDGFRAASVVLDDPSQDALLDPFRWQIRVQETLLEQAAAALAQLRLVAPATGMVEEILFRQGQRVIAGAILMTVVEPRSPAIVAYVPEQLRGTIRSGAPMEVERSDIPGVRFPSRVASISSAVVLVPMRLWTDPRVEEWALAVLLDPIGDEVPGQKLFVRWQ